MKLWQYLVKVLVWLAQPRQQHSVGPAPGHMWIPHLSTGSGPTLSEKGLSVITFTHTCSHK